MPRCGQIRAMGVSKAFGEALAAFYAHKHGLRTTSIRIGNVSDTPADKRRLSIWLKPEDLVQLIRIGLEHPDIVCEIFLRRVGQCTRLLGQCAEAFRFGYRPAGRAEDYPRRSAQGRCRAAARSDRRVVPGRPLLQR